MSADSIGSNSTQQQASHPLVYVWRAAVFSFSKDRQLRMTDSIDELVDQIIGICQARPEFLQPEDAARHEFFLRAFKNWETPSLLQPWGVGRGRESTNLRQSSVRVGRLPISTLALLLPHWVMSYFLDSRQLMPQYALDSAVFVQSMIGGARGIEPEPWRTEPLLWPDGIGFINFSESFQKGVYTPDAIDSHRCRARRRKCHDAFSR